jgi:hypothetical protein
VRLDDRWAVGHGTWAAVCFPAATSEPNPAEPGGGPR